MYMYVVSEGCNGLPQPQVGSINYTDMFAGSVAVYTCNETVGRTCVSGDNWTGSPPSCACKAGRILFVMYLI